MTWLARYRVKTFFRSSICIAPIVSMGAALLVAPVVRRLDELTRWTLFGFSPDGARALVGALNSSLLTFIVFAFTMVLLVVQMAGAQLSPRIIAPIFETRFLKTALSTFVFSHTYSLAALARVESRVPQLPVALALMLCLASTAFFIYVIQNAALSLRPVRVLTLMAGWTRRVIDSVYPNPFSTDGTGRAALSLDPAEAARTLHHRGPPGVLLAFDPGGLVEAVRRADCVVEMVPEVGDFVNDGEDLFRVYGAGAAAVRDEDLRCCVALGPERTLEQDPAFGFRIIVDIASKALSPAINDPTTAVLAIDQLHHLLQVLSARHLDTGVVRDSEGQVRLAHRTPNWEDYVLLAGTEIRLYGGQSPQVTRRLAAMYGHLLRVVPPERAPALRVEMEFLHRTVERGFGNPGDRSLAKVGDRQGFGSRRADVGLANVRRRVEVHGAGGPAAPGHAPGAAGLSGTDEEAQDPQRGGRR